MSIIILYFTNGLPLINVHYRELLLINGHNNVVVNIIIIIMKLITLHVFYNLGFEVLTPVVMKSSGV
jgi:hypothetical protein